MRFFGSKTKSWPLTPLPKTPVLNGPPLSVIVVCHEMAGQIGNTLHTLLPPYQEQVDTHQYEVVVVDNGSAKPLATSIWSQGDNVRYAHVPKSQASVNPGVTINWAVAGSRSPMLCLILDGARMLTPGVLRWGIDLAMMSQNTLVDVRGWDLAASPDRIKWQEDPYKLFEDATASVSSVGGFGGLATQSTCLFLSRTLFDRIGGFDERYREPGGGFCNIDFFFRAVKASDRVFTLLGEGSFHQPHDGRNEKPEAAFMRRKKEYEKLSRRWKLPPVNYQSVLAGHLPSECRRWLR